MPRIMCSTEQVTNYTVIVYRVPAMVIFNDYIDIGTDECQFWTKLSPKLTYYASIMPRASFEPK